MRVSELSSASGVPVATIKYYLREGLLPRGEVTTSANQASYGAAHVRRLALIRSLVDVGGLSISAVRKVLDAVDDPSVPLHQMLGATMETITPGPAGAEHDEYRARAADEIGRLIADRGWRVSGTSPARDTAIDVLATMRRVGGDRLAGLLTPYAAAVERIAEADLDTVSAVPDRDLRAEAALIGTVLGDHLLAALRRLAQENVSATRFAPPPPEST
ncbi:MAG: MerR family transcriptional regulator [Pseudonocardia sp.]|nr:MerR family transcriptional regulator [Pseudonocardia sp.]